MPGRELPSSAKPGMRGSGTREPHPDLTSLMVEPWLRNELHDQFLNVNKKLDLLLEQVSIYSVHAHGPSGTIEAIQLWSRMDSGGEGVPPAVADPTSNTAFGPQELVRRYKAPPLRIPAASALSAAEPPADESNDLPLSGEAARSSKMATAAVTWDQDYVWDNIPREEYEPGDSFQLGESATQRGSQSELGEQRSSVNKKSQTQAKARQNASMRRPSLLTSMFGDNAGPKGRPAITSILSHKTQFSDKGHRRCYLYAVWEFLEEPESSTSAAWYHKFMFALIITSCVWNFLQTMEPPPLKGDFSIAMEVVFDLIFLMELAMRFLATLNKARFFCIIHNTIDFLGAFPPLVLRILSSYILADEYLSEEKFNMRTALLCLVPVLRLLKMLRRWEKFNLLIFSGADLILEIMPVLIVMMFLMALSFSSLIYFVEPQSNIPDLEKALWLTIVTMTTVGYGDTVPKTSPGMYITLVLVISSALYMAVPLGIVGNAFSQVWEDRDWLFLVQQVRDRLDQNNYKADDIPRLFKLFGGKSGELTLSDFYRMIMEMRLGIKEDRVLKLFMSFDTDSSGTIDSIEFVRAIFPGSYADMYGKHCEELSSLGSCDDLPEPPRSSGVPSSLPSSARSSKASVSANSGLSAKQWAPDWSSTSSRARRSYVEEMNRRMHGSEFAGLRMHGSGSSSNPLKHLEIIEAKSATKMRQSRRVSTKAAASPKNSVSSARYSDLSGSLVFGSMSVQSVNSNASLTSIKETQEDAENEVDSPKVDSPTALDGAKF